jgi:AGZA family xanthine/uracil permease-like MFS transporter
MSDLVDTIDKFFRISERGSTIQQEIRGGVITFLAMAYILIVNPNILADAAAGYSWDALFTATALAAIIACLLMGIYSRFPVAVAPGMGVNAFLSYTICLGMGFTFPQGLMVVFISGILFLILTVTGLRVKILDSIPMSMKYAISAGIGFFIAIVGLFNGGIIVHGNGSALALGNIADPGVLLSIFCILVTLALWFRGWWGAVIVGMVLTWIVGLIMGAMDVTSVLVSDGIFLIPQWTSDVMSSPDFSLFFALFTDFEMFESSLFISFIAAIVSLFVVDMFDTAGTLIGVGTEAGMIDKDGHLIDGEKALTCDAIGTMAGALVGTSTTTSFIESTTGIAAGARTGLMSVIVGLLFLVALFFSPFFGTFTSACTTGALVLVGILMIKNVKDIDWKDPVLAGMAFATIFLMGLCGSITDGIAFGIFFYVLGMVITGRSKEVTPMIWGLAVVFLVYFFVNGIVIPNGWI